MELITWQDIIFPVVQNLPYISFGYNPVIMNLHLFSRYFVNAKTFFI